MNKRTVYNKFVRFLGKLQILERDIWQVQPLLDQAQYLNEVTLLNFTKTQGVTPQVYHNLQKLKASGFEMSCLNPFLEEAQQYVEMMRSYREKLFADLALFAEVAGEAQIRFMTVKGACFKNLYPTESFRTMFDIDLLISQETVWKGIDAFKRIRHRPKRIRLERYPWSTQDIEGTSGIAEMFQLDGDLSDYPFDLHLGGFPGCGDGLLELDLWERARTQKIGNQEILMPSLEDCILIICSHVSRHGYAKLRDLNDIHVCLKYTTGGLNWDYLSHFSIKNSLQTILYGLLDSMRDDYEVQIPDKVMSKLRSKRLESFSSKMLFSTGRKNPNFHGGRQLVAGRFLQSVFLYNYYRDRADFLTALKESLSGLCFLFQSGRPYGLWKQRKIQSFRINRRIVIIPIEAAIKKARWHIEQIHLQKAEQFALKSGVSVERIGNGCVVWNVGHPNELILTPEGIYTQSAYNGDIDEAVLTKIQQVAWDLATQLNEIGAIQAKRIETALESVYP